MAERQRLRTRLRLCVRILHTAIQHAGDRWKLFQGKAKPAPERSFFDQVKEEVLAEKRLPTGSHQMLVVMKVLGRKEEVTSGKRPLSDVVKEETEAVLEKGW